MNTLVLDLIKQSIESVYMWSDNDTAVDFLGFQVHSDLIRSVVTTKTMLPVTIGLFGDWGSGKSSVMRMLQRDLSTQEKVVCISFNGWQFEGYDDAKTALIQSILEELIKNRSFGKKVKDKAEHLIKRVNWLRLFTTGYQTFAAPIIASYLAAATGLPPAPPIPTTPETAAPKLDLNEIINKNPANNMIQNVREFQQEFCELIEQTGLDALVILIDDLDRCSPERLIDTLEAIKLFLAVPRIGFVIGADARLVRYAIASRYSGFDEQDELISAKKSDIITDYVEKLIQIPYYLPRLAPNELETYINLLFCQLMLEDNDFEAVVSACKDTRHQKRFGIFGYVDIKSALMLRQKSLTIELEKQITLSQMISPPLADILKGNPRQTKRLMNALLLRQQLAEVADIQFDWGVLVKLMVLEYINPKLFGDLYHMQARQQGFPKELVAMETAVTSSLEISKDDFPSIYWQDETILNWLRMQPSLSQVDLRDYFWLTRDRIHSLLAGVSLVPPIVRRLLADMAGREGIAKTEGFKEQLRSLQSEEQDIMLQELEGLLKRSPSNNLLFANWVELGMTFPDIAVNLISVLEQFRDGVISNDIPIAPMRLALLYLHVPQVRNSIDQLFIKWKSNSKLQKAVEDAQRSLSGIR